MEESKKYFSITFFVTKLTKISGEQYKLSHENFEMEACDYEDWFDDRRHFEAFEQFQKEEDSDKK